MFKITSIKTEFSENSQLANREFKTAIEFDVAILEATQSQDITDLWYDKTDVFITWEDGRTEKIRIDANRTNTLSDYFRSLYRYYCKSSNDKPEHLTVMQWEKARNQYWQFFKNYAI